LGGKSGTCNGTKMCSTIGEKKKEGGKRKTRTKSLRRNGKKK